MRKDLHELTSGHQKDLLMGHKQTEKTDQFCIEAKKKILVHTSSYVLALCMRQGKKTCLVSGIGSHLPGYSHIKQPVLKLWGKALRSKKMNAVAFTGRCGGFYGS